jgi:hypothetical protein
MGCRFSFATWQQCSSPSAIGAGSSFLRQEKRPGTKHEAVSGIYASSSDAVRHCLLHEFFIENRETARVANPLLEGQVMGKAPMFSAGGFVTILCGDHFEDG